MLHGYPRLTADVDLVVDLEPEEARKALSALVELGLRPRVPVSALDFSDPEKRNRWIAEKGMKVMTFWDPKNPMLVVDLFVEHPIDFKELWGHSQEMPLEGSFVRVSSLSDLIRLKKISGRPRDLDDIEKLEEIQRMKKEPGEAP